MSVCSEHQHRNVSTQVCVFVCVLSSRHHIQANCFHVNRAGLVSEPHIAVICPVKAPSKENGHVLRETGKTKGRQKSKGGGGEPQQTKYAKVITGLNSDQQIHQFLSLINSLFPAGTNQTTNQKQIN